MTCTLGNMMFFDAFIPQSQKQDFEILQKSRILVAIILICSFIFITALAWVNFAPNVVQQGQLLGNIICCIAIIGYSFCLAFFHYGGSLSHTAHITIGVSYASIIAGIAVSGGPLFAPATVMILLPIIMAFILIDKQAGLVWTLVIMIVHIAMVLLHTVNFHYPQLLPDTMLPVQHLAHWFMAYTAIIGLMYFSDAINDKLQQALDAKQRHFEHLASHDTLTQLANRFLFDSNLSQAIQRSRQTQRPFALLVIDLDNFKPINDNLGHDAGDIALKEIALRLKKSVRATDTVARLGGDEFAIILEQLNSTADVDKIATLISENLKQPIKQLSSQPVLGGSIGIAFYPTHSKEKEQLQKLADIAMYQAKKNKGTWRVYQG